MISEFIELFVLMIFIVLFPIVWILATPFILGGSLFVDGDYRSNIIRGYKVVSKTWIDWGVHIIP
jgi:hypothetical protein